MRLDRRSFVKAGAAASALAGPVTAARAMAPAPALVVYDSRYPESRAFADGHDAPRLDLASEHGQLWRGLRAGLPDGRVVGLTRWSDFVIVRGVAGDQRKRLRHEHRLGRFFVWELA